MGKTVSLVRKYPSWFIRWLNFQYAINFPHQVTIIIHHINVFQVQSQVKYQLMQLSLKHVYFGQCGREQQLATFPYATSEYPSMFQACDWATGWKIASGLVSNSLRAFCAYTVKREQLKYKFQFDVHTCSLYYCKQMTGTNTSVWLQKLAKNLGLYNVEHRWLHS